MPQVQGYREKPRRLSAQDLEVLIEKSMQRFRRRNPHPKCELYFESPYQLLVSVVLSAQTTDKMVNRCMEPLYKSGLTPKDVLRMGEQGIYEKIRSIGLAPTKSKNVVKLSKIIYETYHGEIPESREDLEALPGVGRKTANVILGEIFGEPTLAVDTHVYRVTKRLGIHKESSPQKAEAVLLRKIPAKWLPKAHHWFILLGRYTCLARNPKCDVCFLKDICPSFEPKKLSKART